MSTLSVEAKREWAKRYRLEMLALDPEFDKKKQARKKRCNPAAYLLNRARNNSKRKGLDYALTEDWYNSIDTGECSVSHIPWDYNNYGCRKSPFAPSIDRIDPDRGYIPDNCRLVCWIINCAMADYPDSFFWTMVTSANAYVPENLKPTTETGAA